MPNSSQLQVAEAASKSPANRLIVLIAIIVGGFCALCGAVLMEARRSTWERAAEAGMSLASAIENDVSRNIGAIDLSLQTLIDNLGNPEILRLDPVLRHKILFDRSVKSGQPDAIMILDPWGNVYLDSRGVDTPAVNLADRDYFQSHKNNEASGLHIGRPFVGRVSGIWMMSLSRRLTYPDGSFAGVAVASLPLSYFQKLFQQSVMGPNGNISLARNDGILLMRWPGTAEFVGTDIRRARLFELLPKARAGRFESVAATDGVRRLFAYSQIGQLPLVVVVGQSIADIYATWRNYALGILVLIALLCAMIVVLAIHLIRELNRRKLAETSLAMQAMTDSLTQLSNRRHFNEVLEHEWQRAGRGQTRIALLILDADRFKAYNDTLGHQAGDRVLATIGAAIANCAKRGGDLGVRYGGDEFALLLPETQSADAEQIGNSIRRNFADLCQQTGVVPLGLSIGIACALPHEGGSADEFVEAADRALYRAKHRGRNRTELASGPAIDPVKAPDPVIDEAAAERPDQETPERSHAA